jgi:hypothetical protein
VFGFGYDRKIGVFQGAILRKQCVQKILHDNFCYQAKKLAARNGV